MPSLPASDHEGSRQLPEVGVIAALPLGSRLLHIGLMKSGTTAIQNAAAARRPLLRRHGVLYPGQRYNHRQAALALMRRPAPAPVVPPPADPWQELLTEVNTSHASRVWISNEFICGSDDQTARRFLDDLGPTTHVVITIRSVAGQLPSVWQQHLKTGSTLDFETFLEEVLAHPDPAAAAEDPSFLPPDHARHDVGAVVARWARLVGPTNLTVVVGDPAQPHLVQNAFESLLDLPPGALAPVIGSGFETNRSLTLTETALVLEVNRRLPRGALTEDETVRVLRNGAIRRILEHPTSHTNNARPDLPLWATDQIVALGREFAHVIDNLGVRVIGNLDDLSRLPTPTPSPAPTQVPLELAAEAILGAISGALARGSDFGALRPPVSAPAAVALRRSRLSRVPGGRRVARLLRRLRRRLQRAPTAPPAASGAEESRDNAPSEQDRDPN